MRRTLPVAVILFAFIPNIAQCQIILTLTDGGDSTVNWRFSGSSMINPGRNVSALSTNSLRLPPSTSWNSFFSAGTFDDLGSDLLNISNVSPGTRVTVSGNPAVFVDGSRVGLAGGGFATEGDWLVDFSSAPAMRFLSTRIGNHNYPALSGGEVISVTGSGTFDVGSGTFTTNFNVGSYSHVGTTGLNTQVNVGPEPSSLPLTPLGAEPRSSLERQLLGAANDQLAKFAEGHKRGLIEVAPVHLPVDPPGDCNHYGWPVATMVDETIIVMHRRIPGHTGPSRAGWPNEKHSYGIVLRSEDGGRTWSEPYDLRMCMKPLDRYRGGLVPLSHRYKFDPENKSKQGYPIHLYAIATTRDGAVVAINNHGVFRSEDEGKTWQHFSKALREDTFPREIFSVGPRLIDHPQQGLLAFGNWFGPAGKPTTAHKKLVVLKSTDGGATWTDEEYDAGFSQFAPAALLHEGRFLFIARHEDKRNTHTQMTWTPGQNPKVILSNLKPGLGTVDLSFNPLTQRLEVCRSNRNALDIILWSMDPGDWETGQWRRDCRLFARGGRFYRNADGFHPAAAVMDRKRGVQHIFIYSGHPNGPAGVFRITRTLDTPKLVKFLKPAGDPDGSG